MLDWNSLPLALEPLSVVPPLEVAAVPPSSPAYQVARQLQVDRYTRACMPGEDTYLKYQSIVDATPERVIPLVVRRRNMAADGLVGTARLELASSSTIEAIVHFQAGSLAASVLAQRAFAEVGVFATQPELAWWQKLDVMDTVAGAAVQLAEERGIEWLWIFPRLTMMSLLLAEIPGLLPPYHFTLCQDVVGWDEESATLQKIRALHMKELPVAPGTLPLIIQITPAQWAQDLKARIALREHRLQHPALPRLVSMAMRQAHRRIADQISQLYIQKGQKESSMLKPGKRQTEPAAVVSPGAASPIPDRAPAPLQEGEGFLPFAVEKQDEADYLRQVVEQGGEAATGYKTVSYDLLQLAPGRQVLDVGCGIGVDLPTLADRVGTEGLVIGLDHDPILLKTAKEACAGRSNLRLVVAEAQELPFPNRSFDAVRADRVLQYIPESAQVLAEMARVLRPGGTVALVEPDWRTVALFPASPAGGDDDHTWSALVQLCRRRLPHALIGRQLAALLRQQGTSLWEDVQARVVAYTFFSWQVTNTLLQISNLAQALIQEEPARTEEINTWLQAMETADRRGEFFACVPMFFAYARKRDSK